MSCDNIFAVHNSAIVIFLIKGGLKAFTHLTEEIISVSTVIFVCTHVIVYN